MTVIKSELITRITTQFPNLAEKSVISAVNTILEQMSNTLSRGDRIEIRGFGTFCLHYHAPRNAHNPRTGEKVTTHGKYSPHFKPGKLLRQKVNDSKAEVEIQSDHHDDDGE